MLVLKSIVVLQTVLLVIGAPDFDLADLPPEWHAWKSQHGITYEDKHEELRKHVTWKANHKYIEEHNKYKDVFGFDLEMNKFGDLSTAEFQERMMCVQEINRRNVTKSLMEENHKFKGKVSEFQMPQGVTLPDTVDWRTGGAVTHVKDQLRCGCSYAFAAAGALEGATALAKGSCDSLSAQNIVDCSIPYGNNGCSCGDVTKAFMYIIDNGGLDTEKSYPFISRQYSCRYKSSGKGATSTGFVTITSGNEESLAMALATAGPIAVYVDATSASFQFYKSGVLNVPNCSRSVLTHALVLIGYGGDSGKSYWLLKNSWGPNWGIRGYAKMSRGKSNQCGIASYAVFPTL